MGENIRLLLGLIEKLNEYWIEGNASINADKMSKGRLINCAFQRFANDLFFSVSEMKTGVVSPTRKAGDLS
jgi:hypothetical protein